ncbi:MAG: LacI family DNA-binding transcriptional regulator [Acidimicrobiia bacterium]
MPTEPTSRGATPKSLRHVAELAGVSVATASRVMSGSAHPVSEATRQRVLSAADSLAFEPNRLARALVTARSQTIGVIVHDISDPYFGEIVKGLEDGLHADDYRLFVASSDRDPDKELSYVRTFDAHQVDAIVFAASSLTDPEYVSSLTSLVDRFRTRGGIVAMLSDHFLDGPRVLFDNRRAVTEMVGYLAERGHRRIGFIGGPSELEVSHVRRAAFEEASGSLGLETGPQYTADGGFTMSGGGKAVVELLEKAEVTAILAASDLMAIGATRQLLSSGLAVPQDISIAGFDDIPIAEYGPVPLTTMRVPTYEIGRKGADLLLAALSDQDVTDIELPGQIVERDSVAPVRSAS